MNIVKACATAGLLTLASLAQASVTLNFEGLTDDTPVGAAYLASHGITFGANALAVGSQAADASFSGLFTNTPSGVMAAVVFDENNPLTGSYRINVLGGFEGSLSLSYLTRLSNAGGNVYGVRLFDELGGDLFQAALASVPQDGCGILACNWRSTGELQFTGRAFSVEIYGNNGALFVDDLTFGAQDGRVPEPAGLALVLAGFGAAAVGTRRRRQGTSA